MMPALLAYDTRPDTDSSEVFKLIRYSPSTTLPADRPSRQNLQRRPGAE